MNKLIIGLISAVGLLFAALFFGFNYMYLPERDLRILKENEVLAYVGKIERFNENEKTYIKKIKEFEENTISCEVYRNWARELVPDRVVKLLQDK